MNAVASALVPDRDAAPADVGDDAVGVVDLLLGTNVENVGAAHFLQVSPSHSRHSSRYPPQQVQLSFDL